VPCGAVRQGPILNSSGAVEATLRNLSNSMPAITLPISRTLGTIVDNCAPRLWRKGNSLESLSLFHPSSQKEHRVSCVASRVFKISWMGCRVPAFVMSFDGCHSLDVFITSDQPAPASLDCVVAQLSSSFRLTQSVSASHYHSAYLFVLRKLVHVTSFRPTIGATTRYKACTCKAARVNARVVESLLWLASSIMSHHTGTTVDDSSCHDEKR
jgi:hypothetical protein